MVGDQVIAAGIVLAVLYLLFHGHHVHRNYRRHKLSIWVSLAGPFGTRISRRF